MKSTRATLALVLFMAGPSWGSVIASYNPDTLTAGTTTTTMADQSGNGHTLTGSVPIANSNSTFNGHKYGDYVLGSGSGLSTSALYSGANARTFSAVYDVATTAHNNGGGFEAQIAGQIGGNDSFGIESRQNNVTGD